MVITYWVLKSLFSIERLKVKSRRALNLPKVSVWFLTLGSSQTESLCSLAFEKKAPIVFLGFWELYELFMYCLSSESENSAFWVLRGDADL